MMQSVYRKGGDVLRLGSLFAGIGGFDLAAERAGIRVAWQSEIDPYASAVLAHHWPDVPNLGDITQMDGTQVEPVDIITAGPPCQPVSLAGKGLGADDERWLWPDTLRVIGECRPRWVLLENPPALLSRGFGDILGTLADLGYDAEWQVISAAAVGAWHKRRRLWIIAYPNCDEHEVGPHAIRRAPAPLVFTDPDSFRRFRWTGQLGTAGREESTHGHPRDVADAEGYGRRSRRARGSFAGYSWEPEPERALSVAGRHSERQLEPQGCLREEWRRPSDGTWWAAEPDVVRVAYGIPNVVDRIAGLGNAIVPQVAEWILRRIVEVDSAAP